MKNPTFILGLMLLFSLANASGQNSPLLGSSKLFIVKADRKTLITDSNGISIDKVSLNSDSAVYLNSSWVKSMDVLKGEDAIDKYGLRGQNGVVIIYLSENGFAAMRPRDKDKFRSSE